MWRSTPSRSYGTDSWKPYSRDARYIHVDIDGNEIGRNYEAMRLTGDPRETLRALVEALWRRDLSGGADARVDLEDRIAAGRSMSWRESEPLRTSAARPIRPERIMEELQKVLTDAAVVVADASYSSIWISNYLKASRPGQRFLTPRGLAGLG